MDPFPQPRWTKLLEPVALLASRLVTASKSTFGSQMPPFGKNDFALNSSINFNKEERIGGGGNWRDDSMV